MKKVFVCGDDFPREILRSEAKGHKKIVIADDVEPTDIITMRTEGDTLVIERGEDDGVDDEPAYVMLCKDFGLFGYEKKFYSKMSYILCDDGWMLVTLYKGAVVLNLNDKLMMPSRDVTNLPKFDESSVLWVDKDLLMRYSQYMKDKSVYPFDFEFMVELGGTFAGKLSSFRFLHLDEEDVDLSLGYFAKYLQVKQAKEDAKKAQKLQAQIAKASESSGFEFEDDDDDDSDYDDYDEDSDEYDDY